MSTITTRAGKGSPLTNTELDSNFTNLNTDKIENVVEDTTPQLGGDLSTNGNDINFGDNDKAIFGAGSDLKIYHTGSHSYIDESGTGNLYISSNGAGTLITGGGGTQARFFTGGQVDLWYNNVQKLATTSTGISVTGTTDTDSITLPNGWTVTESGGSLYFAVSGTNKMKLASDGTLQVAGDVEANATIS